MYSIFHSLSTVYRTDQPTFGEAFITVNTKTGIITDISTTLPPNNVHTLIELGSNLLLPGAIDLYAGATQEQESDNWSGVSTAEHSRIETVTKICAQSGITTVVETPLLQLFPDTIPSTPAKLKDKWQLINNPAICKTIDYGLLASVEDVNDVSQLAASGHCLGLMVVVGSPIGPLKRSPRSVESLKILKIAKEASKYSTTTMKGALFIKAEHYSARQLRLASPLRMHDVQERRRTDLSIDHPAYMLGLKMNPELSSSFDINRSDEFERDMKRHEQRTRAASALPGQLYVGSDTTSAPSSVARKERRISPKSIHTNNNKSTNDLQHQEQKHSDDAVNIKKSSSFSGKGGLTGLWQLTMSGTTPTDSETRNHNVLRVRSPTVKTIGGLRNHSFSAFHTSPKSSNSSFSSSKNNTFISALLSEELKSYGHGNQTNETRSGSNTNHNNHNINYINQNNSAPRPLNTKSLSGTSSSSSSSGGSISNSNISPRSITPKSPLQFGTSNDVELHTSITGHQGSASRTSWSSDNNGTKRSTSTGSNSSLGSDCDSRASFELLVQHSKEKSLQVRSIALNKKISNRNVDLVVRSSSRSFQGTTSTATASVSAIVDPRTSSPISLPMAIPGTLGSTLGTGSNSTNDFVEMARKQREDMWGEMVAPEPDEFPISPPKLKRMQGSKMPSLLERRRKRMEKLQTEREAATTTSSSESSQHNGGSGSGSGSGSSESHSTNSRLETRIKTENTPPIVGSFGEAPGFIVSPLQVFKVPDTLTTTAISANYTIYMSQRPESAEVDAVTAVIEGIPTGLILDEKEISKKTTDVPLHFCSVSSALAVSVVEACRRACAMENTYDISVGTSPQYLHLSSELLTSSNPHVLTHATLAKCSPPVRSHTNQRMLREGLASGAITAVSTFTIQCELRHKMMHTNDLIRSVGGVDGIETFVSSCWTYCLDTGKSPIDLVQMISTEPARLLGFQNMKGVIQIGAQADFCVIDPDAKVNFDQITPTNVFHSIPQPLLYGVVQSTWVRGKCVYAAHAQHSIKLNVGKALGHL